MTLNTFKSLFQEYMYTAWLREHDKVKYHLIKRYEDKVSQRLLDELPRLLTTGKDSFEVVLNDLLSKPSIFETLGIQKNTWTHHLPIRLE